LRKITVTVSSTFDAAEWLGKYLEGDDGDVDLARAMLQAFAKSFMSAHVKGQWDLPGGGHEISPRPFCCCLAGPPLGGPSLDALGVSDVPESQGGTS
jgi:hypothetical protein